MAAEKREANIVYIYIYIIMLRLMGLFSLFVVTTAYLKQSQGR